MEIVKLLCGCEGLDIELGDKYGNTPLSIANRYKYTHIRSELENYSRRYDPGISSSSASIMDV